MHFPLFLVATLISVCHASALALPISDTDSLKREVEIRAPSPACGDPRKGVPLLRAYSGGAADHFYTTNADEMQNAVTRLGYTAEGTTGYVFSNQQPGTIPLYRLYSGGGTDHFYTTSAPERDNAAKNLGYTLEGTAGFVYPNANCGGLPLYRSYNGGATDHFYTMSAAERDSAKGGGWAYEGIAAYTLPF